jgi:anti-sigma B factor antagonist
MASDMPQVAEFVVSSERQGPSHLLAISGELDLATAPSLERELLRVEQTEVNLITVDLSGVTFIDGVGVHLLCDADLRSCATGSRLRLVAVSLSVRRVLWLLGVDKDLPFDPNERPQPARIGARALEERERLRLPDASPAGTVVRTAAVRAAASPEPPAT